MITINAGAVLGLRVACFEYSSIVFPLIQMSRYLRLYEAPLWISCDLVFIFIRFVFLIHGDPLQVSG